jgi:hypothetical protein
MIVVDSSVWIGALADAVNPQVGALFSISDRTQILLGDVIMLEVLRGVRPDMSVWAAAPGSPCYMTVDGAAASSFQPTAIPALFVCPNYHGPTSIVIDLSTMRLTASRAADDEVALT